jgi:hypothetical protein
MKFKILSVLLLSGLTACAQIPAKEGTEETENPLSKNKPVSLIYPSRI